MNDFSEIDSSRVWRSQGFHFCELHTALARFYMREEEFFHRKMNHYCGFIPERAVECYTQRVFEDAEIVVRFGLAACLGEARHFHHRIYHHSYHYIGKNGPASRAFEKARPAHIWIRREAARYSADIRGIVRPDSWGEGGRNSWYKCWLPSSSWLPFLDRLELVFAPVLWGNADEDGNTSYGGFKWQAGVRSLKKVVKALEAESVSGVVIATDSFVNLCHNCGLLLNKFDCGRGLYCTATILNAKHRGHSMILSLVRRSSCRDTECCERKVGILPSEVFEEAYIAKEE